MKDCYTIRMAGPEDGVCLAEFNRTMARETENRELPEAVIKAGVSHLLEHPEYGFYIVAEVGGRVAGCLLITYEWSDWRDGLFWWIQSVYVHPDFRRQGIYRRLHTFVREQARQRGGVCGIRLYVEKDNQAAQNAYATLGMLKTPYLIFEETFSRQESRAKTKEPR